MFDVDDYENYVSIQSESALRHLANAYAYDNGEENETTLRSGVEEVSQALKQELEERLRKAGVAAEEARLTHLAYVAEIDQACLPGLARRVWLVLRLVLHSFLATQDSCFVAKGLRHFAE